MSRDTKECPTSRNVGRVGSMTVCLPRGVIFEAVDDYDKSYVHRDNRQESLRRSEVCNATIETSGHLAVHGVQEITEPVEPELLVANTQD